MSKGDKVIIINEKELIKFHIQQIRINEANPTKVEQTIQKESRKMNELPYNVLVCEWWGGGKLLAVVV